MTPPSTSDAAFHERILALPPQERTALLLDHLQREAAASLGITEADVPLDVPLVEVGPAWREPGAVYLFLLSLARRDFRMPFYPVELRPDFTLRTLAEYLSSEMAPAEAGFVETVTSLYDGGNWAWGPPPAVPTGTSRLPGILFVLSAPRSGSTLFRTMLAGHPALFSPPELNLLQFGSMGERGATIDRLGYSWMRSGPGTAFGEVEGLSPEGVEALLAGLERDDVPVREVYRTLQEAAAPRLLVDKSPVYSTHPGWLRRAEGLFEGSRYLHLVRHPYAVMESIVRMRFHRLLGPHWLVHDPQPWRLAEKIWIACNQHIQKFLAEIDPGRQHLVRYEDMVTDPARTMEGVCHFLGLPFDAALLEPYHGDRMTRRPLSAGSAMELPTVGDPNLLMRDRIDPRLARTWKRVRPPQPVSALTRELAAAFEYELPEKSA